MMHKRQKVSGTSEGNRSLLASFSKCKCGERAQIDMWRRKTAAGLGGRVRGWKSLEYSERGPKRRRNDTIEELQYQCLSWGGLLQLDEL